MRLRLRNLGMPADGVWKLTKTVEVEPEGETRVDWRVRVAQPGQAIDQGQPCFAGGARREGPAQENEIVAEFQPLVSPLPVFNALLRHDRGAHADAVDSACQASSGAGTAGAPGGGRVCLGGTEHGAAGAG